MKHALANVPKYWWILSEQDRAGYNMLRSYIMANRESQHRNKRIPSFRDNIETIKRYIIRGEPDDVKRCIVCGILWLPDAIAINTHQLGFLMSKCKSSINGSFQIMGYKENISRKNASELVANTLLPIQEDKNELRRWTVRYLTIEPSIIEKKTTQKPKNIISDAFDNEQQFAYVFRNEQNIENFEKEDAILNSALKEISAFDPYNTSDYWNMGNIVAEDFFF